MQPMQPMQPSEDLSLFLGLLICALIGYIGNIVTRRYFCSARRHYTNLVANLKVNESDAFVSKSIKGKVWLMMRTYFLDWLSDLPVISILDESKHIWRTLSNFVLFRFRENFCGPTGTPAADDTSPQEQLKIFCIGSEEEFRDLGGDAQFRSYLEDKAYVLTTSNRYGIELDPRCGVPSHDAYPIICTFRRGRGAVGAIEKKAEYKAFFVQSEEEFRNLPGDESFGRCLADRELILVTTDRRGRRVDPMSGVPTDDSFPLQCVFMHKAVCS